MHIKNSEEPYWDIKVLSRYLSIKPCTLYAWAAQGRIPCLKVHGLVRFRRDEIDRWLENIRQRPRAIETRPLYGNTFDINRVIAAAKRATYNSSHGEARLGSSPIGKEEKDGAV